MIKITLWEITKIYTWKLDANAKVEWWIYPFFTCSKDISWINNYAYDSECVLVAWNWDLNVKYYKGKFNAYQRTYIVEDNKSYPIDMKYIYLFLLNYLDRLKSQTIWWVIQYIKINNLTDISIPLPSLEEQRKVAQKLDKIQEVIDTKKEVIAKFGELTKSIFIDMFGDPLVNQKNREIKTIRDLLFSATYWTSEKANEEWIWLEILRMNNLTYSGSFDFSDIKYIKLNEIDFDKYTVKTWDILFNRTNSKELVGKTAVYKSNLIRAYAWYLIRLRVNNNLCISDFVSSYLNSTYGKAILFWMSKNIVWMANINAQEVQNIKIYLPPLSLQQKFADIINKLEEEKKDHQESLKKLEEVYNATMQECFR